MDFELTAEQSMIRDSVTRFMNDRYTFEYRRHIDSTCAPGWCLATWQKFAELGLLAIGFGEEDGGFGGGIETMIVGEVLGAALGAEPYMATVVMGGAALRDGDNAEARATLIPAITEGSLTLACVSEGLTAQRVGDGWRVDGTMRSVIHGDSAGRLVLVARLDDGEGGMLVAHVDATADGIARRGFRTFDGLRAAEISCDGVNVGAGGVLAHGAAGATLAERIG
ncbi:MAG: acyl-CoA dehydrogenase family protein, partial [Sphingomonadales bacterium]